MNELADLLAKLPDPVAATPRVRAALGAFLVPTRPVSRPEEEQLLASARRRDFELGDTRIAAWVWGHGPRVLLVHGWSSRGSHLSAFVAPLLARGFSVATYDAPAHGDTAGALSSVVHHGRAVAEATRAVGPIEAIVAHSVGSAATLWAFREGLRIRASVHIAGPATLANVVRGYAQAFGFSPLETAVFQLAVETCTGEPVARGSVDVLAAGLSHAGLIVHDSGDREVPASESEALHHYWPGSTLWLTTGLGHRRPITDRTVVSRTVDFVSEHVPLLGGRRP